MSRYRIRCIRHMFESLSGDSMSAVYTMQPLFAGMNSRDIFVCDTLDKSHSRVHMLLSVLYPLYIALSRVFYLKNTITAP